MKKVMFYCQHVLGMGHLVRSLEIIRGLKDCRVSFVTGGVMTGELELPPFVKALHLPAMQSDPTFQNIEALDGASSLEELRRERRAILLREWEQFRPDVLIVELFPFGRKQFAFELIPLLARIRSSEAPTRVLCSLRDILVQKSRQERHETRACRLLNQYFDSVLVHADPTFQRLEETFGKLPELSVDVRYTGYVSQSYEPALVGESESEIPQPLNGIPLVVASVGGGRVGHELLEAAIGASQVLLPRLDHRLVVIAGPYCPTDKRLSLEKAIGESSHITLRRFTKAFLPLLAQADLSISMAGYNTCMNLVTTGCRALVLPFTGNNNSEQALRAQKLAERGVLNVLERSELDPHRLAFRIEQTLRKPARTETTDIDLDGVTKTVAFVHEIFESAAPAPGQRKREEYRAAVRASIDQILVPTLRSLQETGERVSVFLRDDDVDVDENTLRQLLDLALSRHVPLNLAIIPATLTEDAIYLLKEHKRLEPNLFDFNQHGFMHENHEPSGKKCEFGPSRSEAEQFADIFEGKKRLEDVFDERFHPVFVPPWNRCTENTYRILGRLNFQVLSTDASIEAASGFGFHQIPVSLDLYRWKPVREMKPPDDILRELARQIDQRRPIGILLHHKVMDPAAFAFLDEVLKTLSGSKVASFATFRELAGRHEQSLAVTS